MEHKKISAVIFDMDGVIVDSEFVYMDYLLEFARKKNPEVTMDQLNHGGRQPEGQLDGNEKCSGQRPDLGGAAG